MGKASRKKKEQRENKMGSSSRKILKQLKRESAPDVFVINGKIIYYNPLKKLLEGEKYVTDDGRSVTSEMVKQYEQFLKTRFRQEKIAKANNIDIEELDKKELENGRKDNGNKGEN